MMKKMITALFLAVSMTCPTPAALATDYAVITHPDNPATSLSMRTLAKIFKADKQQWEDGSRVFLILGKSGSAERKTALEKIFKMSPDELKKHWTTLIYQNKLSAQPKSVGPAASIVKLVAARKGAIAVIPADAITDAVKVIAINGKNPGDADYPLAD